MHRVRSAGIIRQCELKQQRKSRNCVNSAPSADKQECGFWCVSSTDFGNVCRSSNGKLADRFSMFPRNILSRQLRHNDAMYKHGHLPDIKNHAAKEIALWLSPNSNHRCRAFVYRIAKVWLLFGKIKGTQSRGHHLL